MEKLCQLSATQMLNLLKTREISAEALMRTHLEQIEKVNPQINALTQHYPAEDCLRQAREVDQALAAKKPFKPLMGLPVAIKDALLVKGLISSAACSGFYKAGEAKLDATVVARLREAGAIIIGLTNVPEMCRGGDSDNLIYGRTNNPYDRERTSGGSSGGSAALVAAGGVPFALGSDGGGSIMQPSHCCGIAGLKPTHGRFPNTGSLGGLLGVIGPMCSYGILARSVADLALGLPLLSGPDQIDPYAPPIPIEAAPPLKKMRVAYYTDNGYTPVDPEIQKVVRAAALALKAEVDSVVEARPDCVSKAFQLHWDLFLGCDHGKGFKQALSDLGVENLSWELQEFVRQAEASSLTTTEFYARVREIDYFRAEMLSFMRDYDVLICPAFPHVAKPHGIGIKEISDFSYAMTHNLTGCPSISLRAGTSSHGLPIGIMIAANRWKDTTALAVAEKLESLLGGYKAPDLVS